MRTTLLAVITLPTLALALSLFTASCGRGTQKADDAGDATTTKEDAVQALTKHPIPTAFQITQMLNNAGASYILSLSNPVENVDKYLTEKSKALNLGVYGANLAYASTYQMTQETMSYLKVTRRLIDELQITTAFNADLAQRIEDNIESKDTLIDIISDSLYETYEFLNNHGKDNLALLVMTGGWVEGMYITCQIAIISKDNADFLSIVANQKGPLLELLNLLRPVMDDEAIADIYAQLKPLEAIYNEVDGDKLTPKQFEQINEIISRIRYSIV